MSGTGHKFSQNFWGEKGVFVVENKMNQGKKAMDLLLVLVAEHYKLEEMYGREMKKILKKVEELQEIGSLQRVWDTTKVEMDKIAMSHINMANQLRAAVFSPIETFAKEQKETRKTQLIEIKELMREYSHLHGNISRAKSKYDQKCLETVNTEKQFEQSKSKSAPKAQQKIQKLQKDQSVAEQEYQAAVQKLAGYQPGWETKLSQLVDNLQMLEETRMEMVQHSLEKYVDAQKPLEKQINESHQLVAEKLQTVNIDGDMEEWIASNRTGVVPPPVPVFVPFNADNVVIASGSSSPSLSTSNPSLSRNTSDRSLSARVEATSAPSSPSVPHSVANPPPVPTRTRSQTNDPSANASSTSNTNTTPPKANSNNNMNRRTPSVIPSTAKVPEEPSIQEEAQEEEYEEFDVVVAQYEYLGTDPNELQMREGDRIIVLQKHDSGWWMGQSPDGKTGMFPSNFAVPEAEYVPTAP